MSVKSWPVFGCLAVAIQSFTICSKFRRGHARMRGHHDFQHSVIAAGRARLKVAFEQGGERFRRLPLRMLRRERLDAIKHKV